MDNANYHRNLVLTDLRRREHRHSTVSEIQDRTSLSRAAIKVALKSLKSEGLISEQHNPAGGVGRELWSALSPAEVRTMETRRACFRAFREAMPESFDDADVSNLVNAGTALAYALGMDDHSRARLTCALIELDSAYIAEWDSTGNSRVTGDVWEK